MRSFLLGLAAGVVVAPLVALAITWGVIAWRERPPSIRQGTTLVLRLSGFVPEKEPSPWLPFDGRETLTLFSVWRTLAHAAADPRIAALILEPEHPDVGWAKLAEIRAAVASFARTGKPVAAFLRSPNTRDYYLASAAGRISVAPRDHLDVKGLRAELFYLRHALDKFGILPEFESFGRYKDAPDLLTRSSMRPETRQVVEALLDARLEEFVGQVSKGRNKSKDEVKRLLDDGPYLADTAQKAGLVDAVEFEDQMREHLRQRLGQNQLRTVSAEQYQRVPAGRIGLSGAQLLRGRMAGMDSEARALSEEERNKLRGMLQAMYTDFVAQVARMRRRKPEQIEPAAQGRVWLGRDALVHGLVDELGGIERAIQLAREQAGIPSSAQVRIEPFPPRESWFRSTWRRMQGVRLDNFSSPLQKGFWKRLEWDVDIR